MAPQAQIWQAPAMAPQAQIWQAPAPTPAPFPAPTPGRRHRLPIATSRGTQLRRGGRRRSRGSARFRCSMRMSLCYARPPRRCRDNRAAAVRSRPRSRGGCRRRLRNSAKPEGEPPSEPLHPNRGRCPLHPNRGRCPPSEPLHPNRGRCPGRVAHCPTPSQATRRPPRGDHLLST